MVLDEFGIQYHFNGEQNYCAKLCIDGVLSEALRISTNSFVEYQMGQCAHQKSIPELCAGCRGDCNRTNRKLDKN